MKSSFDQLKPKKRRVLLIFGLLLVIAILLFGILYCFFSSSIHKFFQSLSMKNATGGCYTIVDDFDEEDGLLGNFFDGGKDLQNLKNFVGELEDHQSFIYLSIYENPLIVPFDSKFPKEVYSYGDDSVYNSTLSIKAIEINTNAANYYKLPLEEITLTSYEEGFQLPVLLGSEYAEVFEIGDNFLLDYFGLEFTATVRDILDEGTTVERKKEEFCLDEYIVVPFIDCLSLPSTDQERTFQAISYSCRANGDVILDDDYSFSSLQEELNRLTDKYSLPEMMYYRPFD